MNELAMDEYRKHLTSLVDRLVTHVEHLNERVKEMERKVFPQQEPEKPKRPALALVKS